MSILDGLILLVKVQGITRFCYYLEDKGMIFPFRAILCIIWPSGLILGIFTFTHVIYVS